jgi:prevent-host-death family protein
MVMRSIAAGKFKAQCLAIMDEVEAKHETVVITKRGKPVAKLVPVTENRDTLFGCMADKARVVGDLVSPIFSPEEWGENY